MDVSGGGCRKVEVSGGWCWSLLNLPALVGDMASSIITDLAQV